MTSQIEHEAVKLDDAVLDGIQGSGQWVDVGNGRKMWGEAGSSGSIGTTKFASNLDLQSNRPVGNGNFVYWDSKTNSEKPVPKRR